MQKTFEAIYENGILRPLEALRLPDNARVTVTIGDLAASEQDVAGYFSPEEWDASREDR
jgi:predicted DNA-binding antitoxin AbrB/MazE fold protein